MVHELPVLSAEKKHLKGSEFQFIIGSEKYGTHVMKELECDLFLESSLNLAFENMTDEAIENMSTEDDMHLISEINQDMRMIDVMLKVSRMNPAVLVASKNSRGYTRKGMGYYDTLEKMLEARADGAFNY